MSGREFYIKILYLVISCQYSFRFQLLSFPCRAIQRGGENRELNNKHESKGVR